jgi:class 3 adenylate cyclase
MSPAERRVHERLSERVDPRVAQWITALGPDRWAALVLDGNNQLVWVSDELAGFLGERDEVKLGIGKHVLEALLSDTWRVTMTDESQIEIFANAVPFLIHELSPEMIAALPEPFDTLITTVEPRPQPPVWASSFFYIQNDLPPYRVEIIIFQLRDETGERIGTVGVTNFGVRPTLLALLGRGDAAMYERMSRLVTPGRHAAAILFADLQSSGELSRQLPTSKYFEVVRDLTTAFDDVVAAEYGIVGKHVGDGMTGFFLTEDVGTPSGAAAAAIRTSRGLQEAARLAGEQLLADGLTPTALPSFNVGLHWGPSLYLGQLVPGGRLDVTALGDEVNECARIEESAKGGKLYASKQLVELLDSTDAKALDLDPDRLSYRALASLSEASPKALRDAATLAITEVG